MAEIFPVRVNSKYWIVQWQQSLTLATHLLYSDCNQRIYIITTTSCFWSDISQVSTHPSHKCVWYDLTLRSCVSIPGRIMMTDTMVPSSKKKEKTSLVTVELLEEGQHPHRRHGAEPHRQEAYTNKWVVCVWEGNQRELKLWDGQSSKKFKEGQNECGQLLWPIALNKQVLFH